ncbi:MAG TPA: molybdopterin-dependent oxidoreductase [Gemmatimonadota bacterium]|nr:molybdopterin-dependent oxidoreductase [Gemmatimonadota bacterium]
MDRRDFLTLGGAALAAVLAACDSEGPPAARGALDFARRRNETVEEALFRHTSMDLVDPGAPLAGNALPRYYVSPSVPVWDPGVRGAWKLQVTGAVRNPLTLSLDDLTGLPSITHRVNHYCVEGWTAVTEWTGVRVRTLAKLVEPMPDAKFVDFQSFDSGYHESWDLASAVHPQTLVAYGYHGSPLTPAHGAPARLHSPIKLGYKSVKYLTAIVFLPHRNGGYWTDRGYEWYAGT